MTRQMSETVGVLIPASPVPSDGDRSESPSGQRAGSDGQSIEIMEEAEYEERFRVDRRKLEQMLQSSGKGCSEAEDFFLEIMEATNTHITWPSKLKIGAKSKKDPHIKVSGDPDLVKQAREKIMAVLDTKSNRVTLKMDVSHTEHSHVIGKGGNNIKKVMEETGCHIHFPDSNRNNQSDKSNQVSIAGKPYGVESARMKIRDLLPVTLTFEIPVATALQPEQTSPIIIRLQQQYNITVTFKPRARGYQSSIVVIVRGTVNNSNNLKEACLLIMENLMGARLPNMPVSLQLDVAAQHHLFMVGHSGANLQQIMNKTGAQILFPEGNSFTGQKKGTILIQGAIDNVLLAREHVIGCLPLVLMFDMGSELNCSQDSLNALMQKLDLYISVKPKPKQPSKSVILKSIEENYSNMYEARRILLRLDKEDMPPPRNIVQITPHITPQGLLMTQNLLNLNQTKQLILLNQQVIPQLSPAAHTSVNSASPLSSPRIDNTVGKTNTMCHNNNNTAQWSHAHNIHGLIPSSIQSVSQTRRSESPKSADFRDVNQNSRLFSPPSTSSQTSNYNTVNVSAHMNGSSLNNMHNSSPSTPHKSSRQILPSTELDVLTRALKQDLNLKTSGAHLMDFKSTNQAAGQKLQNSGSGQDLRQLQRQQSRSSPSATRRSFSLSMSLSSSKGSLMDMLGEDMNNSRLTESLRAPSRDKLLTNDFLSTDRLLTTSNDRLMGSSNERLMGSNPHLLSPMSVHKDRLMASTNGVIKPPPGLSVPTQGNPLVNPANLEAALADYERKKVLANRAIEQEPSGEARNPTDFWAGLGFSRSMPDSVIRERLKANNIRYDGSNMATTYEQSDEEPSEIWKDSQELSVSTNLYNLSSAISEHNRNNMISMDGYGNYNPVPSPLPQSNVRSWPDKPDQMDMIELLRKYNLDKYIDLFQQQEIDEATFITLNDQDLRELGIETFGARRKMLLAINDLQKHKSSTPKYFSPTPGSNNPFRTTNSSTHQLSTRSFTPHSDVISQSGRW